MDAQDPVDPLALVQRIGALAAQLVGRNRALEAEVADLRDHIEGLSTKLTAAKAANHTLTPTPGRDPLALAEASAHRDTQRLERLRAELDAYLSEVDQRLDALPPHADAPQ